MDFRRLWCSVTLMGALAASAALADWNPSQGVWGKEDANDIRIMTFNVQDTLCRTATKTEGYNSWTALARIVAAMQPDILCLQEIADNTGNGTGSGVDTVTQARNVLVMFFRGGNDPYTGETVTAYVQKYAPDYDLPNIFVSAETDNYNRNAVMTRFDWGDLNGDGVDRYSDIPTITADAYAPGGDGGIRGFAFCELALPDPYIGDLVIGTAHLKAGTSDWPERLVAAENVAYYIDYMLNGAGTGTPDPDGKIADYPTVTNVLADNTPVILCGDWNEDEVTDGRKGPAEWLTQAEFYSGDGTDRDRTNATWDTATVDLVTGSRATISSSKFDYVAWQDSIATLRRSFVFNTASFSSHPDWYPPEILGYPVPSAASGVASDHRPVIADFILPTQTPGDCDCSGEVDFFDIDYFVAALTGEASWVALYRQNHGNQLPTCNYLNADANGDGSVDFFDIDPFVLVLTN